MRLGGVPPGCTTPSAAHDHRIQGDERAHHTQGHRPDLPLQYRLASTLPRHFQRTPALLHSHRLRQGGVHLSGGCAEV